MFRQCIHGLRFTTNDVEKVVSALYDIRKKNLPNHLEKIYKAIILKWINDRSKKLVEYARDVKARWAEQYVDGINNLDFGFEVVVIPYKGQLYGMCFYGILNSDIENKIIESGIAEEYDYPVFPDGGKLDEFKERKKVWDGIFEKTSIPAEVGMIYEIVKPYDLRDLDIVGLCLKMYPDIDKDELM